MRVPELLAPAGGPEALRAAVRCGAGAVYLGSGRFNARRGAENFTPEALARAVEYCHERGVRVFLTLNTLLSDRELPDALTEAKAASRMGVDAVLVQDWGLYDLLRRALPDLPLHASTQMSLFTAGGANEIAALGCERIVLARECSREDAAAILESCPAEIEIFAHGALCMCYSGQCAMSALLGGRSGNRGACAQPCRLPYGVDGPPAGRYPLSLKDNSLAARLPELMDMGVSCLKLEGRMKRPEYVAVVTDIYSRLLRDRRAPTRREAADLEAAFSRQGFTDAYWRGEKGPAMLGVRPPDAPEPKELFARARDRYERENPLVGVRLHCRVSAGEPAVLTASDESGHTVTVAGPVPEAARNRPLTAEDLTARLQKTGGTPYFCDDIQIELGDGLSLSASAVNQLRRDALSALSAARTAPPRRRELPPPPLPENNCAAGTPAWTVSVAGLDQLTPALLALRPARIYVPLEALAGLDALPDFSGQWGAVLPRVWRDRDEPLLRTWLQKAAALGVAGGLAGNLGHLPLLRETGLELWGDYGLNVFNSRSLAFLRDRGLVAACLSFELRFSQMRDLKLCLPAEAVVYGRLPLMLTENCVLGNAKGCPHGPEGPAVPPEGPCRGAHFLQDRTGAKFPLLPAFGHRTELENSRPLYLADRRDWKRLGLAFARLRFTTEAPEECVRVFRAYLEGTPPDGAFTRGLYDRGVS